MLVVEDATVRFAGVAALDGVSFAVGEGEIVAVLGPSGCGKSTLLRVIAGLQPLDAGVVALDGADLAGVAPHRRRVGLMFQDHALFPHLDVGDNVAFGLRMAGLARADRVERVAQLLALVGLDGYERRAVGTLSGGEGQRVALARALAPEPTLLLLDEPLGALDRQLRDRLVEELPALLRALGVSAVHVTHDHDEAFAVADRVAVMAPGRIVRTGGPAEVWADPGTESVARFLGHRNVVEREGRRVVVRADAAVLDPAGECPAVLARRLLRRGREHVVVATERWGELELALGVPASAEVGDEVRLRLDPGRVVEVADDDPW